MSTNNQTKSGTSSTKKVPEMSKKSKNEKPTATSPDLSCIGGIEPGLTIIALSSPRHAIHLKNIFAQAVLDQKPLSGVKMPVVAKMCSLHAGSPRQLKQAAAFNKLYERGESKVKHQIEEFTTRGNFDYLSEAGQLVLIPKIKDIGGGVLTMTQNISGPLTPSMSVALMNICSAANQARTYVLIFIVCDEGFNKLSLQSLCNEYIEVDQCEPDVDADIAFSIDFVGLRDMFLIGVGKTMCQIKSEKGGFQRKHRPFIAADLETRAMWVMRQNKMTLDAIGKRVGLDKSNVLRRLKGLPNLPNYKVNEGWLKRYFDSTAGGDAESGGDD